MIARWRSRVSRWIGDASLSRLIKNASMLFGAEGIATLIGVVQFPIVTRALGAEAYGAWGIAIGWVGLVGQVFAFRLWETIIKFLSQFTAQDDENSALAIIKLAVLIDVCVACLIFLVLNLTADLGAGFVLRTRPDGADLIRLESLNLLMSTTMGVWMAVMRVFDKFRRIAIYNVISAAALFALWMLALALNGDLGALILASAIVKTFQTLALAVMAHRELNARFGARWLTADLRSLQNNWRDIWVMLLSMNIDALRKIAVANADVLALGWLGTPYAAGVYRVAKQLAAYFGRITNPIYDTLYPEVTRLYAAEGPARVRAFVLRLLRGVVLGLVATMAAALLFAGWLIPIIFGHEYTPAVPIFYVVLFSNIWVIGMWVPSVLVAANRAKQLTIINTVCSLAMIAVLPVLVLQWQGLGAALAVLFFYSLWLALGLPTAFNVIKPTTA